MHNYAGNPASFPTNVGLVDDSDLNPATAATLDVSGENLADRTAYLKTRSLDKTGDTITGHVHVGNGAELEVDSGGEIVVDSGANEFVDGNLEVRSGGTFRIDVGATGVVAGTLSAASTNSILATNANTIVSTVDGGIGFGGSVTDFGSLVTSRTKAYYGGPLIALDPDAILNGTGWYRSGGAVIVGQASAIAAAFRLEGHQGATLTSVDVAFVVHTGHSAVPNTLPGIRVWRLDLLAGGAQPTQQSLSSAASTQTFGTLPEPHTLPANAAAWEATQHVQVLTFICNQNNVIDLTRYIYYVELIDENGSGSVAGNIYYSLRPHYSNITDLRFPQ